MQITSTDRDSVSAFSRAEGDKRGQGHGRSMDREIERRPLIGHRVAGDQSAAAFHFPNLSLG